MSEKDDKFLGFWLTPKEAAALKKAQLSVKKKERRKVGIGEIVWPAIKSFIEAHK